jgi:hypothetical protein
MTHVNWKRWPLKALRRQLSAIEASAARLRSVQPKNENERLIYRREIRDSENCADDIRAAIRHHLMNV